MDKTSCGGANEDSEKQYELWDGCGGIGDARAATHRNAVRVQLRPMVDRMATRN